MTQGDMAMMHKEQVEVGVAAGDAATPATPRPLPSRRLRSLAVVSTCLAVVGIGSAAYLGNEIRESRAANARSVHYVEGRLDELESESAARTDLRATQDQVAALDAKIGNLTAGYDVGDVLDLMTDRLDTLNRDIDSVDQAGYETDRFVDLVYEDLEAIRSCLNDYMDIIADVGGGRYTYSHC